RWSPASCSERGWSTRSTRRPSPTRDGPCPSGWPRCSTPRSSTGRSTASPGWCERAGRGCDWSRPVSSAATPWPSPWGRSGSSPSPWSGPSDGPSLMANDIPILTLLVLVPALGAGLVALLPKERDDVVARVGLGVALLVGLLSLILLFGFDTGDGGFQFISAHPWIESFGISWKLGVDGISLFLVVLSGILFPLAIAGPHVHHDRKGYVAWMLLLEAGCIGVFLSLDLFLFFLFWEIVLVPMYFLIGGWGYERRVYATLKF